MNQPARRLLCSMIVLSLSVAPLILAAEPSADSDLSNVKVTFRLGKLENGERVPLKSYDLVVAPGEIGSKLLSGARLPFPTGSGGDGGTVVYQNVGFSTEVRAWVVGADRIKLVADIEDSRVRDGDDGPLPTVETRQLSVSAVLVDGKPLVLTRVDGVADLSGFVEVEARIMR